MDELSDQETFNKNDSVTINLGKSGYYGDGNDSNSDESSDSKSSYDERDKKQKTTQNDSDFKKDVSQCLSQCWDFTKKITSNVLLWCNSSLLKTAVINAYRSWPLFGICTLLFVIFFICTVSTIDVDFDGTELQNASNVASAIRKGLILTLFDAFFLSSIISMVAYEYMLMHNTNRDPISQSDDNNF